MWRTPSSRAHGLFHGCIFKAWITQQAKKFEIAGSHGSDRVSVNAPPGLKEGPLEASALSATNDRPP